MRERDLESMLMRNTRRLGGLALKFVSPGTDGVPDRLVLLPGGRMCFVEVKAPGKAPRPLQVARHKQLRALGFQVYVLDQPEQIPEILGGDAN